MSQAGGFDKSFKAGADLNTTTTDWRAAAINSSGSVVVANSAGARPIGIIQNRPKSGTGASVWVRSVGYSKCYFNDTVSAGGLVYAGASGALPVPASVAGATITSLLGRTTEAVAATGGIGEILIIFGNVPGSLTASYD